MRWGSSSHAEQNLSGVVVAQAEAHDGQRRILMVRRPASIAPHGAWELPAEGVAPGDWAGLDDGDVISASRRAALRALSIGGAQSDESSLNPLSVWLAPPTVPGRRCRWHFVTERLTEPPGDGSLSAPDPTPDQTGEAGDTIWMSVQRALSSHAEREIELAPRTWLTLRLLSDAQAQIDQQPGDAQQPQDAQQRAETQPVSFFMARPARMDDDPVTLLHGDSGYHEADPHASGARHRLHLRRGGWVYERSK